MINISKVTLTCTLLLLTGWVFAQTTPKAFRIYPEKVMPGATVSIHYNPDSTQLKGLAPVTGVIYLYRNFDWEAHDLPLQMTDSGWTASHSIPEGTGLLSCKFMAAGKSDMGGRSTYSWLILDPGGKQMAGAYAGWAFLRARSTQKEVPPVIPDSIFIEDNVVKMWMNWEVRDHAESRRKIYFNAMRILKNIDAGKADSVIIREANFISSQPDVTEQELMDVAKAYKNLLGNKEKADSVEKIILQKFPAGITARDKWVYTLFRQTDPEVRDADWKKFVVMFPPEKFKDVNTETDNLYYNKVYRGVVYNQIIKHNNYNILDEMLPDAPLYCLTEFHRHIVVNSLEHNSTSPAFILPYSKKIIARIEAIAKEKTGVESKFYSPLEWEQQVLKRASAAIAGHAALLNQTGDPKQALVYAEKIKTIQQSRDADYNGLYATLLEKNGRHEDAIQVIENGIRENKATPEMIALLKKEYITKHKSDKGFDAYFNNMKSADKLAAQQEHLRASLMKKEAPLFNLEQMKGGYANLSKQKGKIIVIDFWATWCGPCKAALPGMQMAVDKYQDDSKVDFYFIATQENKPDYKNLIGSFVKEKNYSINVLYDGMNETSRHLDDTYSKYARLLHTSGIPLKLIIDQHGFVRWQSTGYMGSPSALADEISYVIELLKKEA